MYLGVVYNVEHQNWYLRASTVFKFTKFKKHGITRNVSLTSYDHLLSDVKEKVHFNIATLIFY